METEFTNIDDWRKMTENNNSISGIMKENDDHNRWMNKWNNDNSYLMAASWHQGGKLEETAQLAWTGSDTNNPIPL